MRNFFVLSRFSHGDGLSLILGEVDRGIGVGLKAGSFTGAGVGAVTETREGVVEIKPDLTGGTVTVFGNIDDGQTRVFKFRIAGGFAGTAQQQYDVGVLLDGAGVAQVGEFGFVGFIAALFWGTAKLAEHDDR